MTQSSVKQNFTYQMIYEVLALITPLITSPYISRVLGADGVGEYSYSYSIAYYFVLFSMLGIKNYGNREIARVRDNPKKLNQTFSDILCVHVFFSLICTAIYIGYIFIITEGRVYAIIQTAYVISALFDISWFYFGIENFRLTVIRSSIIRILDMICIFIFVKTANDTWLYCLIMALGLLFSQLALWLPIRKYVKFVKPSWASMKIHIKPLFILFLPTIAISLYKYMDKIMLGAISSKAQLGFYENAEKVINIPLTVISSFGTVMLPRMSNLAAKSDDKEAARYTAVSMQFVMCLAMALAFGLAAIGQVFAPVFWGEEFSLSGTLIVGLAITIPFSSFANVVRTQYIIPHQKDREYVLSVVLGAVVNLIINIIFIPIYGAIGATIGTIAAEVVVCFAQVFIVRKELPILSYIKSFAFFILVGIIMFAGVYAYGVIFGESILTLIIQILIGIVFYGCVAMVYFIKTRNTVVINAINSAFRKLRISYRLKD